MRVARLERALINRLPYPLNRNMHMAAEISMEVVPRPEGVVVDLYQLVKSHGVSEKY